jgi:hypothetical protein
MRWSGSGFDAADEVGGLFPGHAARRRHRLSRPRSWPPSSLKPGSAQARRTTTSGRPAGKSALPSRPALVRASVSWARRCLFHGARDTFGFWRWPFPECALCAREPPRVQGCSGRTCRWAVAWATACCRGPPRNAMSDAAPTGSAAYTGADISANRRAPSPAAGQ